MAVPPCPRYCPLPADLEEKTPLGDLAKMSMLHKMRLLEEQGCAFALKPLKSLHTLGFDGDFMHTSQAKTTLLEFIMSGLLDPKRRQEAAFGMQQLSGAAI